MDVNSCVFVGRLSESVLFNENIVEDRARATGRLIINRFKEKGKYDVIPFVAWDKNARTLNNYTAKGKELSLTGSLRTNSKMLKDGSYLNYFELEVHSISLGQEPNPVIKPKGSVVNRTRLKSLRDTLNK